MENKNLIFDAVVVGAGVAGMTAALYLARGGIAPLLIESVVEGGQILQAAWVENMPGVEAASGFAVVEKMKKQLQGLPIARISERANAVKAENGGLWLLQTDKENYRCRTMIFANGAVRRKLQVPGEEELAGRGVSYCATCDGALMRGQAVCVVGGGNTAVEDALTLSGYSRRVTLIHRRAAFRAESAWMMRLKKAENVVILTDTQVVSFEGKERLLGVRVREGTSGEERVIDAAGVFVAIGSMPNNAPFAPPISLDSAGYIQTDEKMATTAPGIFAAGDTRACPLRQIVTAAADGAIAAVSAMAYLKR